MEYYINFINDCKSICDYDDDESDIIEVYRVIDEEFTNCRNHKYCKGKLYKRLNVKNFNLCNRCLTRFGKFELSNEINECCVCLEYLRLIKLPCNHNICNECWYKISFKNVTKRCPLCRIVIK